MGFWVQRYKIFLIIVFLCLYIITFFVVMWPNDDNFSTQTSINKNETANLVTNQNK